MTPTLHSVSTCDRQNAISCVFTVDQFCSTYVMFMNSSASSSPPGCVFPPLLVLLLPLSGSDIQGKVCGASCPTAQSRRSPGAGAVPLARGAAGMGGGGTRKRVRAGRISLDPVSQGHGHRGMQFSRVKPPACTSRLFLILFSVRRGKCV